MRMKRFNRWAAPFLLGLLLASTVSAQTDERPSKVNKIGNALVAYYTKPNLSRVMAPVRTVFDTSSSDFPLAKGAQKIELILSYEFSGEKFSVLRVFRREIDSDPGRYRLCLWIYRWRSCPIRY